MITFETNSQGEQVKVTTLPNGGYIRELDRPALPPAVIIDPTEWLIDLGPFFDRFNGESMTVELSTDAVVQAIGRDFNRRKWIDLQDPRVSAALDAIGAKVPSVTPALKAAILTTPVAPDENLALRKLYFS